MGTRRVRGGEKAVGRNLWEDNRPEAGDTRKEHAGGRSKGESKTKREGERVDKSGTTDK